MQENKGENLVYEFGEFQLDAKEKQLRRLNGEILPLPPKAFELLTVLVENKNRLLEKSELLDKIWADSFVEEGNLKIYIHTLRKTLNSGGENFIETIPRRGYRFNADVRELAKDELIIEKITESKLVIEETEIEEKEFHAPVLTTEKSKSRWNFAYVLVGIALIGTLVYFAFLRSPEQSANNRAVISPQPVAPEAETLYIQGRVYWNERSVDGLKKSIEYFERALEKQPDYAIAFVGLADSYQLLAEYKGMSTNEAYSKARFYATKALEINPNLAEAHNSLAYTQAFFDWDFERGEASFKRAIELDPNFATAHHWYHELLNIQHRFDEAGRELQIARELDPHSPSIQTDIAHQFIVRREYETALKESEKLIAENPKFLYGYLHKYVSLVKSGREKDAVDTLAKLHIAFGEDETLVFERIKAAENGGLKAFWKKMLDQAEDSRLRLRPESIDYALCYLHTGDLDQTFEYLNKALEERNRWFLEITYDPIWDAVRADPRYDELIKKANIKF